MIRFLDPASVPAPMGAYSHTAVVPGGSELVFVSGQVGMRLDGSVPGTFAEQADVVFGNVLACLAAHGLGVEAIVKLQAFIVAGQDVKLMREIRRRHFGNHRPASTTFFVPQLVSPDFLLEVEAIAVKRNA